MKKGALKLGRLVVLKAENPEDPEGWSAVMSDDVPETIKDPEVMGRMRAGEIAQIEGDANHYRVEIVDETR